MKPTVKNFSSTTTQLCGECNGEGKVWKAGTKTHGEDHSRYVECTLCSGTGMLVVTKDTTVTITPHKPKPVPPEV
ncbi:hypothetical protein [Williamwhitmania taraxaci]|uniref:Molecular chaperone DnaJ n=1 Tax=Williamwhitmania taraxaci TaxID=1640674 RepID=A0A1G6ME43_9BACT|nr:hypothetical protein [Williamwhitmania taraxaci]SDC53557.1 hypothetical protein SAMN05216323_103547 [Williamwhitmania taraxaci]